MTDIQTKKAVLYCRVSSAQQTIRTDGLSSQEQRCRQYCEHKGYEVVQVFKDDMSGSLVKRPGMDAMLKFLRSTRKHSHVVVIDDISRLARGIARERLTAPDILAARLAGVGSRRIFAGHVVPHLMLRLATAAALDLGYTLGALAGFSYLGLGAQAPAAEWGAMLKDAQAFATAAPWLLVGPCAAIALVVTAALLLVEPDERGKVRA